ncbi:hypothetical protein EHI42_27935 [Rhizobium hidalgonense]|nr:hypothetical protein EHI42_27935 [Rhizobium hidalgonense]
MRHIPFAPQAGRRCRQADEGLISPISEAGRAVTLNSCSSIVSSLSAARPQRHRHPHFTAQSQKSQ